MGHTTIRTTIKGGLPVMVSATICKAQPSVGLGSRFVDDVEIFWETGTPVPQSLYSWVMDNEWERLEEELLSA